MLLSNIRCHIALDHFRRTRLTVKLQLRRYYSSPLMLSTYTGFGRLGEISPVLSTATKWAPATVGRIVESAHWNVKSDTHSATFHILMPAFHHHHLFALKWHSKTTSAMGTLQSRTAKKIWQPWCSHWLAVRRTVQTGTCLRIALRVWTTF